MFGRTIALNPLPTTLVKGPGPSIWNPKKIDSVLKPPWSLCLAGASSKVDLVDIRCACDFTTLISSLLWPHLQRDSNTLLRLLPWPCFNCHILVMQLEKVVANNVLLFGQ